MFLLLFISLLVHLFIKNADSVVVQTEQGKVRGEFLQVVTGDFQYASFKGIPYAKPPVGDLRFMAPQPLQNWNGVRNATQHGPVCIQLNIYNGVDISGSEDCLYLNVYTPNVKPKKLLPVMLFIPGGGFISGSGNADRYGPDYLITENVVIVTINYRLGALGFLSLDLKDVPGNAGMRDQVAAMKWVQKNIANFGGNPKKVTIIGNSSGGVSVTLHNMSPMTKNLFKRSVAMSGAWFNDWAFPIEPRRIAFRLGQQLGKQLGVMGNNDQQLLDYLKSLPAEMIIVQSPAILKAETPNVIFKQCIYTPVVETDFGEERYLDINPLQALKSGKVNNVELMIGHTEKEGLLAFIVVGDSIMPEFANYSEMIVPREILENISPEKIFPLADKIHKKYFGDKPISKSVVKAFIKYMSETYYNYGVVKFATRFSKLRSTYVYKFTTFTKLGRTVNLDNEFNIERATHEDDLLFLFYSSHGNTTIDKNSEDYKLAKKTCALYANFAKYGNPTPDNSLGIQWPKYDGIDGRYLDIGKKLTLQEHFDAEELSFWDSIYKEAGLEI